MIYNIISTEEMEILLDECIKYLIFKLKNKGAAQHLLEGVSQIYDMLETNPYVYKISQDYFMKSFEYHEAKALLEKRYFLVLKKNLSEVFVPTGSF